MITEEWLKELNGDLPAKLKAAYGRPVCITVSYKDELTDRLEHWIGISASYGNDNTIKTLRHLLDQIEEKPNPMLAGMRRQLRVKKTNALRKARTR